MKNKFSITLLLPVALLLASCTPSSLEMGHNPVRFTARSHGIATKTSYGPFVDDGGKKYAVINWTSGDKIRVYTAEGGDVESGLSEGGFYYCDYALSDISTSGRISSAASITPSAGNLEWVSESGSATFFAIYPNTVAVSASPSLEAEISIPSAQGGDASTVGTMPLVATKTADYSQDVDLSFTPAFSTFEFTIKSAENSGTMYLRSATLSTRDDPSNVAYVSGKGYYDFTGGSFTYDDAAKSRSAKVTFASPQEISPAKDFTFYLFTLPADMGYMTLTLVYTKDGNLVEKHLELSQGGTPLTFGAGHYTRITGLALKDTGIRLFLGTGQVNPLDDKPHVIKY